MSLNLDELEYNTPMMQQWLEIKRDHADCLVLFRLGDFYELFEDDAKIGAEVLGITLTTRKRGSDGRIPMCGVPYHALDSYLGKLVRAGYKVAICEQVEEAGESSGMVERAVVRVVTPGTILDEKNLRQKENNYILGVEVSKGQLGLAYADLSTGEMFVYQRDLENSSLEKVLAAEVLRVRPAEVVSSHQIYNRGEVLRALRVVPQANVFPHDNWEKATREYQRLLQEHFGVVSLEGFGIKPAGNVLALQAAGGLLNYLKETQQSALKHIKKLTPFWSSRFLRLDSMTIRNLELFATMRGDERGGTLVEVLDHTHTAAGGRKLRGWLLRPLKERAGIEERLDAVDRLRSAVEERQAVQEWLGQVLDIERLVSRVAVGTANPRDVEGLRVSLENVAEIADFLAGDLPELAYIVPQEVVEGVRPVVDLIGSRLQEDPPATLTDGGYIAEGVSEELDEYRDILQGSQDWLSQFEQRQKQKTGIESLKVERNKVFGFYIEVSKSNLGKVPPEYIRKQTLVNSERYIVPELKEREEAALEAEEKSRLLERELFAQLLDEVLEYVEPLQYAAQQTAVLDVYCSLAEVAQKNRYVRPEIREGGELVIDEGRHPVVEWVQQEKAFIPNDLAMAEEDSQVLLITGPNMAGKSTFLRQVALVTLMAQLGSFVPAARAVVPVRDQIFTRVGASDNVSLGQSTFLVEMIETANILNNCTSQSLVIFDEIGRGTSTYDGMSIAWAVIEYLVKNKERAAYTLFATHYHELTVLSKKFPAVANFQMAVEREGDEIIFLYKVIAGSAWQSYGVKVAELAGLPPEVVKRAEAVLRKVKHEQRAVSVTGSGTDDDQQITLLGEDSV